MIRVVDELQEKGGPQAPGIASGNIHEVKVAVRDQS